jgi:hypothetical protein
MYNIGYGGVRDPSIQTLLDNKDEADKLIEKIQGASERA